MMLGHIELCEAVIVTADKRTLQAPLYRVDGGVWRRVSNGHPPSRIIKTEPMSEWRQAEFMGQARKMARVG